MAVDDSSNRLAALVSMVDGVGFGACMARIRPEVGSSSPPEGRDNDASTVNM